MPTHKFCTGCQRYHPIEDFRTKQAASGAWLPVPRCRDAERADGRKYRAENTEARRASNLRWYHANRDRERARMREYERREKGRRAAYRKAYRAANPDQGLRYARKRYALTRGAEDGEHIEPLVVLERDDGVCGICDEDVDPTNFQVDHIVPVSRGGPHVYWNVQVAHQACNGGKRERLAADPPAPLHIGVR